MGRGLPAPAFQTIANDPAVTALSLRVFLRTPHKNMPDLVLTETETDDVIGYITRGRGVSIHRSDCPNVLNLADRPERRVDIEWDTDESQRFLVRLVLEGTDRHGLFADIARSISDTGTNIQSADIRAVEGGMQGQFVVEVENLSHLKKVMKQVRRVKGVIAIERRESFGESDLTIETL